MKFTTSGKPRCHRCLRRATHECGYHRSNGQPACLVACAEHAKMHTDGLPFELVNQIVAALGSQVEVNSVFLALQEAGVACSLDAVQNALWLRFPDRFTKALARRSEAMQRSHPARAVAPAPNVPGALRVSDIDLSVGICGRPDLRCVAIVDGGKVKLLEDHPSASRFDPTPIYPTGWGHFALGSPDGEVLYPGQPVEIALAGARIAGTIRSGSLGDYFEATDGTICGMTAGMLVTRRVEAGGARAAGEPVPSGY